MLACTRAWLLVSESVAFGRHFPGKSTDSRSSRLRYLVRIRRQELIFAGRRSQRNLARPKWIRWPLTVLQLLLQSILSEWFPVSGRLSRASYPSRFFSISWRDYAVPYPQVVVVQPDPDMDAYDDEDYEGGPTIFDRRGSQGHRPRVQFVEPQPAPTPQSIATATPSEPVVSQPSTLLVFRDGHQIELQNYAIVGGTLFDLADNRSHKIQLADLDLAATRKANDSRGVDFQVPSETAR